MKALKFIPLCVLALSMAFTSCEKDPIDLDDIVEDGLYIKGEAAAFTKLTAKAILTPTPNEVDGVLRSGFMDIYVSLEKDKTFNIVEVEGTTQTVYGPATTFETVNQADVADQMTGSIQKGGYQEGGTFTVPVSGLYHIAIDKETQTIVIMPVTHWAIIGSATDAGWGETDATKMMPGTFSKDTMTFAMTNVVLRAGDFKFRHSGAWKQTILATPDVKLNTNYKGTLTEGDAGKYTLTALTVGGMDNIALVKEKEGKYTVSATWGPNTGMQFSLVKTGDVDALPFPENMYITGSDFAWGWDAPATMNPVHSHAHAFWAIIYCSAAAEFKFAPQKAWGGDFGVNGTPTNGVYAKGGSNIVIPVAGYYMVYVDLVQEKISVTVPTIYGMGDTFGGWTKDVPANLFTIDNVAKTISSPAVTAAGNIRMYTTCPLALTDASPVDWWQMEFNVIGGVIAYRGKGGDQAGVPVTVGQRAVLNFQAGTGTIQ